VTTPETPPAAANSAGQTGGTGPDSDWSSAAGRKQWQQRLQEANEVLHAGQGLLRKHKKALEGDAVVAIERALEALSAAIGTAGKVPQLGQPETLQQVTVTADQVVALHLGHLRKSAGREYVEAIAWAMILTVLIRAFVFEAFKIPTGSMIPTLQIQDHLFVNKFLYGLKIPFTRIKFLAIRQPQPGEVIVFEYPYDDDPDSSGKDLIKRVIAVEGQRVRLRDNRLYIDGKLVPRKVLQGSGSCGPDQASAFRCNVAQECLGGFVYTTQHHVSAVDGEPSLTNSPDWPFPPGEEGNYGPQAQAYASAENKDWPDFVVPKGQLFVMGDNRDNSKDGRFFGLVPLNTVKGKAGIRWYATDTSRIGEFIHTETADGTCGGFLP
jgi:signal peptidase I